LQRNALAQLRTGTFHPLPCLHIFFLRELQMHQVNQKDARIYETHRSTGFLE